MKRLRIVATVLITSAIATFLVAAPAQADPVPDLDRLLVSRMSSTYQSSGYVTFGVDVVTSSGQPPATGIHVILRTYDCHGRQTASYEEFAPYWEFDGSSSFLPSVYLKDHALGPLTWTLSVTHPGYEPYDVTGAYNPKDWPCRPLVDGDADVVIEKWSEKKPQFRKAEVGRKLAVTPTRTSAPRIAYDWFVGGKRYYVGRSIRVRQSMVGKAIMMTITVRNENETKSQHKTIRFGRVRR